MSGRYLGDVFDIHGGGLDLIFPHHENEIAQSRCAHGTDVMANVWMHNGFLQVEGRKMSKSEGNFVTIYELLHTETFAGRQWPGEVLRLAMLMTHYREPIDFSWNKLIEASNTISKWKRAAELLSSPSTAPIDPQVLKALADDLGTQRAVQRLSAIAGSAFASFHERGTVSEQEVQQEQQMLVATLVASAKLLGFNLLEKTEIDEAVAAEIDARVKARLELLKAKNFAEADKIRDTLAAEGIQLKDGKDPETGERVTTWVVKK
jgi:cysteinyl-tRNA synthetase